MAAQRFTLPTLPFSREVYNGCAIGTSIIVDAETYDDRIKVATIQLSSVNDIALNVQVPVGRGQIRASARISGTFTSEIEQPIEFVPKRRFKLHIRVNAHVFEIYNNDVHIMDFVHRVSPLEVKSVTIEGPLIAHEVVFIPPQGASLDRLPDYNEAMTTGIPVDELSRLNLNTREGEKPRVVEPAGTLPYRGVDSGPLPQPIGIAPRPSGSPIPPPNGPTELNYEKGPSGMPRPPPMAADSMRSQAPPVGLVTPQQMPSAPATVVPERNPPYPVNVAPIAQPTREKQPPYPDARTMPPYPQPHNEARSTPYENYPSYEQSRLPSNPSNPAYEQSRSPSNRNNPTYEQSRAPSNVVQQQPLQGAPPGVPGPSGSSYNPQTANPYYGPSAPSYPAYPVDSKPAYPGSSAPTGAPYYPPAASYPGTSAPYGAPGYNTYNQTPVSNYPQHAGAVPQYSPYGAPMAGHAYPQYGYGYSSYDAPYYGYDHCGRVRHCSSGSSC